MAWSSTSNTLIMVVADVHTRPYGLAPSETAPFACSERQIRPGIGIDAFVLRAVVSLGPSAADLAQNREVLGQRVIDSAGNLAVLAQKVGDRSRIFGAGEIQLTDTVVRAELHGAQGICALK